MLILPALMQNIQSQVKVKRIQNINQKFSKATDKMLAISGVSGYNDTMSFVQELSKHLAITKICDNYHLRECWPTEKVITGDNNKTWNIADTQEAKHFQLFGKLGDWDKTVGIVTNDGTSFILSYNKDCNISSDKSVLWSGDKSESTSCLVGVFDWNGSKKPNKYKDDVIAFNGIGGLGNSCGIETSNGCFSAPFMSAPLSRTECDNLKSELDITACGYDIDYWAGSVRDCGGKSNMVDMTDIGYIAQKLYHLPNPLGPYDSLQWQESYNYDEALGVSLGFPSMAPFAIYSNEEISSRAAYYKHFNRDQIDSRGYNHRHTGYFTICKIN